MGLTVRMFPAEGGEVLLDGQTFDPRIRYAVGEAVAVMIKPAAGYQFSGWSGDVPAGREAGVPLEVTIPEDNQDITATFVTGVEHAQGLVFDSGFENGNGILRYQHQESRALVIEPQQTRGADNIWWHFKVHGITPGEFLQLQIMHNPTTEPEFAGDCHPVYSYDGITWHRFTGAKSPFIQRFAAPTVEIARNIPYPYTKTLELAAQMVGSHVQVMDLATSEEGRAVKMFRFTDPGIPDASKRVIWVMARQHAFESHSSWYAEGLARWQLSDHPLAAELRRKAILYVTPMMDVDNVYNGGAGKEQLSHDGRRVDLNRSWGKDPPWAVIRAAKRLLERAKGRHDIAAFIDLHSPWYSDPPHWHIRHEFGEQAAAFADVWSAELEATGSDACWKHWLRVKPQGSQRSAEPTPGMIGAAEYAGQRLFDRCEDHICCTIETPHWHDGYGTFVSTRTLYAYGEALGRALARLLGAHL